VLFPKRNVRVPRPPTWKEWRVVNGEFKLLSALSAHGLPFVVEPVVKEVEVTVDNPKYRELQVKLQKYSDRTLYEQRFAPFCQATPGMKAHWKKIDFGYELLSGIPREINVVERVILPFSEVQKKRSALFPGSKPIQVEKNAQTFAQGLWVLGLPSSVYQECYTDLRKLNESGQKDYVSNLAQCAITSLLAIQKIRPKWFTGLTYEQLYGIYTLRRALAPKSKSAPVLESIKHLTIPHPPENNRIFEETVISALQDLSIRPRVSLKLHRSFKACFECGQSDGGINGFSNKMFQTRSRNHPDLFRADLRPTPDIPVFTEDIAQRGYEQEKEGMHLLEIAMHQLTHQGTPKLLGSIIEERGMKSRIPLVPQWCAAIVAAAIGDCVKPFVERFCKSTFRGQIHNKDRKAAPWFSSGDFKDSSDNLKFEKLKIAGRHMLNTCTWPVQFAPYKEKLLECLEKLLGEHLVFDLDPKQLAEVRARFSRRETVPDFKFESKWRLDKDGLYRYPNEKNQDKKCVWAPWLDYEGPHPRKLGEEMPAFLKRLERLSKRHYAWTHEKVPYPAWTGTKGVIGKIGPVTRPCTFQELQLKYSYLKQFPHIRTARGVHMCYGLSFPIMSFMTWISHYEMVREIVPNLLPKPIEKAIFAFDITGDDNSSTHENVESMDKLDSKFVDKGFIVNREKSYRSQLGYVHAENVFIYPIYGTQERKRVEIREPKMKVLFPEIGGANWSELPQIVWKSFNRCSPEIQIRAQSLLLSRYWQSYKKCKAAGIDLYSLPREPILPFRLDDQQPHNAMLRPVLEGRFDEIQSLFVNRARAPRALIPLADIRNILTFCREEPNHLEPSSVAPARTKDYTLKGLGDITSQWLTEPPWRVLQIPLKPIAITPDIVINRFNMIPNKMGHINLPDIPKGIDEGKNISSSIEDLTRGFHWVPYGERVDLRGKWPLATHFTVIDYRNMIRDYTGYSFFDVLSAFIDYFDIKDYEAIYLVDDWHVGIEQRIGRHWLLRGYPNADKTIIDLCKRGRGCWKRLLTKDQDLIRRCRRFGRLEVVSIIDFRDFPLKVRTRGKDLHAIMGWPAGFKKSSWYNMLKHVLVGLKARGIDPWTDQKALGLAAQIPADELPGVLVKLGARPDDRWDDFRLGLNQRVIDECKRYEKEVGPLPPSIMEEKEGFVPRAKLAPPKAPIDFKRDTEIKAAALAPLPIQKPRVEPPPKKEVKQKPRSGRFQEKAAPRTQSRGRGRKKSESTNWRRR